MSELSEKLSRILVASGMEDVRQEALEELRALEADNTALRKRMEGLEEAISDFWVDRDIWDFDERGVPETWYPVGAIAEELAKALLDAHLSHAEKEA